ncbi:peptidoglycan DD-metalloendopeptidase family protein [Sphingobacterium sp. DK4209]|uniref:Peptidoglycan DD-metalloendopeptidase family protein n=1 Tax=Sphingobacterium zhuxiongii TaxID=2662364 RepID=A0A5Q0QE79_9SPHI|nr:MULTISPECIES: M23 family metallopeptidase [unclassified Sphingobacterium]MVZ66016.1 peptidoglycan DD-metalloendopeptidase family protein [Sphingobacterium sp. DK4209]QGA27529.1 peptidoglycan DD-metalloendopeptidase family protein [Sphingobacterium sp. dk4302]
MRKTLIALLLVSTFGFSTQAQNKNIYTSRDYPQGYFRNPLNIAQDASGTFGELRSTHFHAGDDYRTQQKIGLPLHAAAAGYVSRVRVQIGGGGNSVYIAHPNGFTSVYLHMDGFNDALTNIIRAEQYKQQRFDVDLELKEGQVKLTKGQFIGNAGNTGGSAGPHLHFEIRDTKTQRPLNPQLFGLQFADSFAPTINGVMVYDLNDPIFNEFTGRRYQNIKALGSGRYTLASAAPISVNGKFGLGINSIDRHRAGGFQNGVYSIDLFLDGHPISTTVFEELDFNTSRGIHSYIDYPHWKKTKVKVQKSFKDPGNPIEIFKHLENQGIIELKDQEVHDIKYVVKDVKGNCSELNFQIKNNPSYQPKANPIKGEHFLFNKENKFSADHLQLEIPTETLYGDLDFIYKQNAQIANGYSHVHQIQSDLIPLFSSYMLSIKPTNLPPHLESKALIASVQNGAEGGKFEDGWVSVNTRNFGSFYVAVDSIAPIISPRNLTNGKNLSAQSKIDFTISDNFSGIQSFNGYIDDKWVLMEYDSKNRHVWHRFEPSLPKGQHKFKLVVKDWKDNEKIYEATFTR